MPHTCTVYCQSTIHALPALMNPAITPTADDVLAWVQADMAARLPGATVLRVRPAEVEAPLWAADPAQFCHPERLEPRMRAAWLVWVHVPDWPPAPAWPR